MKLWKFTKFLGVSLAAFLFVTLVIFAYEYVNYRTYCIDINNKTAINIKPNVPVEFNGVVVGKIQRIKFDAKNPQKITAILRVTSKTPISKGTRASVDNSPFVMLTDDGQSQEPLASESDRKYPFILTAEEKPSEKEVSLEKIAAALDKFNELVGSLLTEENTENLSQIMYSLQQVAGVLSANTENIEKIIVSLANTTDEFSPMLQTINKQTLPRVYQVMDNVDVLLMTLQQIAKTVKQNPTVMIRGKPRPVLGPGEKLTGTSQ